MRKNFIDNYTYGYLASLKIQRQHYYIFQQCNIFLIQFLSLCHADKSVTALITLENISLHVSTLMFGQYLSRG